VDRQTPTVQAVKRLGCTTKMLILLGYYVVSGSITGSGKD